MEKNDHFAKGNGPNGKNNHFAKRNGPNGKNTAEEGNKK